MSNENTTTTELTAEQKEARKTAMAAASKVFVTREEALAAKPDPAVLKIKLVQVTSPENKVSWTYANFPDAALVRCVKAAGWKAVTDGKAPTKEKVGSMFAQLTDADRLALLQIYAPGLVQQMTPSAPTKGDEPAPAEKLEPAEKPDQPAPSGTKPSGRKNK
ncbi:MAG TPA: hypothetical protein VH592_14115 [Gemmataceae bacterium]|jgi:hypothetical protein